MVRPTLAVVESWLFQRDALALLVVRRYSPRRRRGDLRPPSQSLLGDHHHDAPARRCRGDRGPAFAQLGLAMLLRAPDERELRGELAFEALLGARLGEQVAVLAELTASVLDQSIVCQFVCAEERTGFTHLVSGNLGVRVTLRRVALGMRVILPLIDDPSPYLGGTDILGDTDSPSLSLEASARFQVIGVLCAPFRLRSPRPDLLGA
jgi:hypothetical protein